MKIVDEFKAFISRGNVVDMAVGIIVGSAFTKIVSSLVADIITPLISFLTGKVNLTDLKFVVNESLAFTYGNFIQAVIDFLIISFVVFIMVKALNKARERFEKKVEEEKIEEAATPSNEELLLTEIRDLLKKEN